MEIFQSQNNDTRLTMTSLDDSEVEIFGHRSHVTVGCLECRKDPTARVR